MKRRYLLTRLALPLEHHARGRDNSTCNINYSYSPWAIPIEATKVDIYTLSWKCKHEDTHRLEVVFWLGFEVLGAHLEGSQSRSC